MPKTSSRALHPLAQLRNVGPAALQDFALLGIHTPEELARQEPEDLYHRLAQLSGRSQDPCVLDVFSATVHQARTGEAIDWWHFSRRRKATRDNLAKNR